MKRFLGKDKGKRKDNQPPSNAAEAAAAEELKEWTSAPNLGPSGWGAPPTPAYEPPPPPAYSPPPPAYEPPAPAYDPPPLGYSPPPPPSFNPPAGGPAISGSTAGIGAHASSPLGFDEAPGNEEEAVTEIALMDYASRSGGRPEDAMLRINVAQAESMRDRALREHLERQKKLQREKEAENLEAKAEVARQRFAARRAEVDFEEELEQYEAAAPPEPTPKPLTSFEAVAAKFGLTASPSPKRKTKPKAKKSPAKKALAKKAPAKKSPAKKSPAKKSPAKKSPAKKSPAKKSPAKKAPAKKAPAKKAPAKKAPAKKAPAKKSPAKKALAKKAPAKKK
ncbi:MAG: histone H1-like repetitive region-containing protein [Actinomycetota bacterium]